MENKETKKPIPEKLKDEQLDMVTGGSMGHENPPYVIKSKPQPELLVIDTDSPNRKPYITLETISFDPLADPTLQLGHGIDNVGVEIEMIQSQVPQRSRED